LPQKYLHKNLPFHHQVFPIKSENHFQQNQKYFNYAKND
jgi:hypothetical protein